MRVLPGPLVALLLVHTALGRPDARNPTKDELLELNRAPGEPVGRGKVADQVQSPAKATTSARTYVGTEDAPVDGLDGKPHAGPFVDTKPEEIKPKKSRKKGSKAAARPEPTLLDKLVREGIKGDDGLRREDIPDKIDGVMNDDHRPLPKKGTTGTEGGVSEKSREKLRKGKAENKPPEPKEAPPLPHSEQERIAAERERTTGERSGTETSKDDSEAGDTRRTKAKGGEYGAGGHGIDMPTDLPEKPHKMPHPDPKAASLPRKTDRTGWLQDTMPYTEGTKPAPAAPPPADEVEWHEWFHSFVLSLTMILVSEIGDKTFLVAALMAMRHARLLVFSAAFSALVAMTVLSAVLGHALPTLLPKRLTTFAAAVLFLVFGARMLREGLDMPRDSGVGEEMKEVEAELAEKAQTVSADALESGKAKEAATNGKKGGRMNGLSNLLSLVLSPAWVQTFVMTFLGEWGDRSQIATIAMAAGQDYVWVTLGALVGHACCTGLAVIGGRALAGRVSMRLVTIGGAVAFLAFGLIYLYECAVE
ncbi:UPF0016-domain-containing protein [Piedraia hortae CBS 480.64]|uniref:UPF0016-domain-containing protein n=1 Tax=Piedraia hortae CBS 480.64 TaxID=1314780 RepID=A0A6A7C8S3_9PEZI|nr:UPF0016-domain-containing protein [Piedraia hortae CBS 480.64]